MTAASVHLHSRRHVVPGARCRHANLWHMPSVTVSTPPQPVGKTASYRKPRRVVKANTSYEDEPEAVELSQARHIITVDNFAPELTQELRSIFDEAFADPRRTHPRRFVWDYWHCPDQNGTPQYNLVRTQAQVYFDATLHEKLTDTLLAYGETNLGCRAITPIWMSYYTDGMMQELHCDNPHGPFAFVLSLTPWESREFTGGETMILRPQILNYWHRPNPSSGLEYRDLVQLVPPIFGRLTIFVHGTRDPRKGRLVLHGWFTDPSPFFTGGLEADDCAPVLNEALSGALATLAEGVDSYDDDDDEEEEEEAGPGLGSHPCSGVLSLRIHVSGTTGEVLDVSFLADTLVPLPSVDVNPAEVRAAVQQELKLWFMDAEFPVAKDGQDTFITLPVVFE